MAVPCARSLFVALALVLAGCSKAVDEPGAPPPTPSATPVAPLLFDTPGAWTKLQGRRRAGPRRVVPPLEKVGNDKEECWR